jgi:hypothetical protein
MGTYNDIENKHDLSRIPKHLKRSINNNLCTQRAWIHIKVYHEQLTEKYEAIVPSPLGAYRMTNIPKTVMIETNTAILTSHKSI